MDDNVYARLVSMKDSGTDGSSLPLFRGKLYHIGRDLKCEVKIADPSVLSYHCCIDYVELEGARITPAVGTHIIVNGNETAEPVMLQNGDTVRLGNKMLRIDVRRILPTRENEEPPQPLLVDMITPPRVTKMTVRAKTQCKSLLSSTKPPVVAVSKKAEDSPVKRQLFSDDENENKKPVTNRSTRKTAAGKKDEEQSGDTTAAGHARGGRAGKEAAAKKKIEKKKTVKKLVEQEKTESAPVTRRSSRKTTTGGRALTEKASRKTVRFSSRTKP